MGSFEKRARYTVFKMREPHFKVYSGPGLPKKTRTLRVRVAKLEGLPRMIAKYLKVRAKNKTVVMDIVAGQTQKNTGNIQSFRYFGENIHVLKDKIEFSKRRRCVADFWVFLRRS